MKNINHSFHHRHWHYLYEKRRRRVLGINPKQMAASQVFSLLGSVVAGALLESNKVTLAFVAGAFVILPGVFDLTGTLGAVISAKINHRLEDPNAKSWQVFGGTVGYSMLIALLGGAIVATVGAGLATWFFDASFVFVFKLATLAIVLCGLFGFPLIGLLSLLARQRDMNPDDVIGPIESSIFDILTVISMVLVIGWLS